MAGQAKVVDASVLVKCFVRETGSEKSRKLINNHISNNITLFAPDILIYEMANALRYNLLDPEYIAKSIQDLINFQIHMERPTETLVKKAAEISIKHKMSMYDGFYVALAELLGAKLITFDRGLLNLPISEKP